jgi:DNA-directed RNA polymerase specialized sigma24 family protein
MVYWTAYGLTNNHHTALELTQTVFLKAFVRWDTVNALAPPQARSWLYRAAKNAAIDRMRHERRELAAECVPEREDMDVSALPEAALLQTEQQRPYGRKWSPAQSVPGP